MLKEVKTMGGPGSGRRPGSGRGGRIIREKNWNYIPGKGITMGKKPKSTKPSKGLVKYWLSHGKTSEGYKRSK